VAECEGPAPQGLNCENDRVKLAVVLIAGVAALAGCADTRSPAPLDVATTTSVKNSGLLDALIAAYSERPIRAHAAGSGRALEMLVDGIVNLVISHASDAEARYLKEHPDWIYKKFAYNRFVIVGPGDDPARIKGTQDAVEAARRIAASGSIFVSRGDGSGTHEREESLWAAAGTKPTAAHLLVSGRGMALALRHADERRAYTLTDEATFWQFEKQLALEALLADDPRLLNTYAVIHPRHDDIAASFADWLTRREGREVIDRFTVAGRPAFILWPVGCPDTRPDAGVCPS
jgi:tungstate transport system substrate-binding protein